MTIEVGDWARNSRGQLGRVQSVMRSPYRLFAVVLTVSRDCLRDADWVFPRECFAVMPTDAEHKQWEEALATIGLAMAVKEGSR